MCNYCDECNYYFNIDQENEVDELAPEYWYNLGSHEQILKYYGANKLREMLGCDILHSKALALACMSHVDRVSKFLNDGIDENLFSGNIMLRVKKQMSTKDE